MDAFLHAKKAKPSLLKRDLSLIMNDASDTFSKSRQQTDTVAVIMAAMNAEDTIGRAVQSALAQPEASQVIVISDGSIDNTANAARDVDDGTGRLQIIELDQNVGPAAARNIGLQHVTADWFTILDSDDFMDDGRLGRMLALGAEDHDFIADDLWLVLEGDEFGDRDTMWDDNSPSVRKPLTLDYFVRANIPVKGRKRRELGFIKPLIRMERFKALNLKYDEGMRLSEDFDLYCRLLSDGGRALLTEPQGYVAVRRSDSLSARHDHNALRAVYESALDLQALPNLSTDETKALADYRAMSSRRYRWPWLIHAVKSRRINEIGACFRTSPDVIVYLFGKLVETTLGKASKRVDA